MTNDLATAPTAYTRLLDTLREHGSTVRERGQGQAVARCPAHDDKNPSLSVAAGAGSVLMHCHAGCEPVDVLTALGLRPSDLYDNPYGSRYDYQADDGHTVRTVHRTPEKRFRQEVHEQGTVTRYRLPQVRAAVAAGQPVWLVEGEKDADNLATLAGVTATTAPMGAANFGKVVVEPLRGAHVIAVVDRDTAGDRWAADVAATLTGVAAAVELRRTTVGKDASDHLAAGLDLDELEPYTAPQRPGVWPPVTLDEAHEVFRRWLGAGYDGDALDVVLAAAAVERLDGDPLWLLLLSGSGNAKTETVQALTGAGAILTSTIASEGALLSATSKRERSKDATGGLLREVEPTGLLVVKDVTSILSMNRDLRAQVLGALREVYDGRWDRNVGTDGGRTLTWQGRVGLVGAVTTAWDSARDVIASMGDRFVIVRMDSHHGRQAAGRQAISNTGSEPRMRAELARAAGGVISGMNMNPVEITLAETDALLAAADVVTLARTGVEYDYRGDVIDAHDPEMPTRFAKQLAQVVRGAVAIGVGRSTALRLAIRCARDSMPPLRLAILDDVAANPGSSTVDVRRRVGKPRATVDRQLQALHMLGVLVCTEVTLPYGTETRTQWKYTLADRINPDALNPESVPETSVPTPRPSKERGRESDAPRPGSDKSGTRRNVEPTSPHPELAAYRAVRDAARRESA